MKNKSIISAILTVFLLLFSCGEYDTMVTNSVHEDGSVTRKVVMSKNDNEAFDPGQYLVPIDSTWNIDSSMNISTHNDTTWTLTAEKLFNNVDEINATYRADTASNSFMNRSASFNKRYRWFFTVIRFSEQVDRILEIEYPADTFMTAEESRYFYLPESIRENLENGSDSSIYQKLSEDVESGLEKSFWRAVIQQMILDFHRLATKNSSYELKLEELESRIDDFYAKIIENEDTENYEEDQLIKDVMGEDFYEKYSSELDSASVILEDYFEKYMDASTYDMEIIMPGKLIASNGYLETNDTITSSNNLIWSVSGDYFFTQDYKMWAESRIINVYAWIISGIIVVLAIILLIFQRIRRHN